MHGIAFQLSRLSTSGKNVFFLSSDMTLAEPADEEGAKFCTKSRALAQTTHARPAFTLNLLSRFGLLLDPNF